MCEGMGLGMCRSLLTRADLFNRGGRQNHVVHVLNVDIKDNPEEAAIGGRGILELVRSLTEAESLHVLESHMTRVLAAWQKNHPGLPLLHTVAYY